MSDGLCATCVTAGCPWRSDMVLGCSRYTPKPETNYERLFGTPERAARTLARNSGEHAVCKLPTWTTSSCDYDAWLRWMRDDA